MWGIGRSQGLRTCWAALVACWLVAALGCRAQVSPTTRQFDLEGAQAVRVELAPRSGNLIVREGALGLAQAHLNQDPAVGQPKLTYTVRQERGLLAAAQPEVRDAASVPGPGVWDWTLNASIPMDLDITTGDGASHLDVGHLNLTHLVVTAGAGRTVIDLDGPRDQELFVRLRAGAGPLEVTLPDEVGVLVGIEGDPSRVDAPGMTAKGTALVSPAYGQALPTLHVALYTGEGEIRLRLAEPPAEMP